MQITHTLSVAKWKNIILYYQRKKQRWAICLQSQLYFLLEHIYIFKHIHKSNIKFAIFELKSSQIFWDQPYKEVLEVKCQIWIFTYVLSFTGVFEDFDYIFPIFFCRISHHLICKKFTILKNKKDRKTVFIYNILANAFSLVTKLSIPKLPLVTAITNIKN